MHKEYIILSLSLEKSQDALIKEVLLRVDICLILSCPRKKYIYIYIRELEKIMHACKLQGNFSEFSLTVLYKVYAEYIKNNAIFNSHSKKKYKETISALILNCYLQKEHNL